MVSGLNKTDEKNLREALARLKKVESRGPHFSWTERNDLHQARIAIERRLNPDAVPMLLATVTRLCDPLEFLINHSIDNVAEATC